MWDFLSKNCGIFSSKGRGGQKSGIFDNEGGIFAVQDLATLAMRVITNHNSLFMITICWLQHF